MCLARLDIYLSNSFLGTGQVLRFDNRLKISEYPNSVVELRVHSCERSESDPSKRRECEFV